MSRPPANFMAEELQADEDQEREDAVDVWSEMVDAVMRFGVIASLIFLAGMVLTLRCCA